MFGHSVLDKEEAIIDKIYEYNTGIIDDSKIMGLLARAYDDLIPGHVKIFVPQDKFVGACMGRKAEIIKAVNNKVRKSTFKVIS